MQMLVEFGTVSRMEHIDGLSKIILVLAVWQVETHNEYIANRQTRHLPVNINNDILKRDMVEVMLLIPKDSIII